jgi:hypothetical protein
MKRSISKPSSPPEQVPLFARAIGPRFFTGYGIKKSGAVAAGRKKRHPGGGCLEVLLTDVTRKRFFDRVVSARPPRSSPVAPGGLGEIALPKNRLPHNAANIIVSSSVFRNRVKVT